MSSLCKVFRFCDLFRFSNSVNQWLDNFDRLINEVCTARHGLNGSHCCQNASAKYGEANDNSVQAAHIECKNWKPRKMKKSFSLNQKFELLRHLRKNSRYLNDYL